jgi:hypothetical protein
VRLVLVLSSADTDCSLERIPIAFIFKKITYNYNMFKVLWQMCDWITGLSCVWNVLERLYFCVCEED